MSIGDPHQEEEEGQMAACASGRTTEPGKGLQRVREESARREERYGQRIRDANLEDGAGLVDEEIGGHDNQPRPRRKILWAAIGAAAGLAVTVLPLVALVMKMGKENERLRLNEKIRENEITQERLERQVEKLQDQHKENAAALEKSREDIDKTNQRVNVGLIVAAAVKLLGLF